MSSPDTVQSDAAAVGRPRDRRLDDAILEATRRMLVDHGYAGATITGIADLAGTTTPTVYRRWATKAELVLDAAFRTRGPDVVADTDDVWDDVRAMVGSSIERLGGPVGRAALAGLLSEAPGGSPEVATRLDDLWAVLGDRLRRAVDAGELRDDLDVTALIAAITGPALHTAIVYGDAAHTDDMVDALVSVIRDGIGNRDQHESRNR